jgi:hypothetical protein
VLTRRAADTPSTTPNAVAMTMLGSMRSSVLGAMRVSIACTG